MNPRRNHPGFTLIELILVLVIIGTMLAVVAPRLIGLRDRARLDGQTRTLHAMLGEARTRAMQDAVPWHVVIDRDNHEAWLEQRTTHGDERPQSTVGTVASLDKEIEIEWVSQLQQGGALITITFQPSGVTEPGQLVLIDDRDVQTALTCASYTEGFRIGEAPASSDAAKAGAYVEQ